MAVTAAAAAAACQAGKECELVTQASAVETTAVAKATGSATAEQALAAAEIGRRRKAVEVTGSRVAAVQEAAAAAAQEVMPPLATFDDH